MGLKKCFSLVAAVIVLIAAFSAFAQIKRPDFNRARTFDAQIDTIRASFDRENKTVLGDTTVSLKPLAADFRLVELDAVDLVFESVKLDPSGVALQYKITPGKVIVTLDKSYGPDDLIAIRFNIRRLQKRESILSQPRPARSVRDIRLRSGPRARRTKPGTGSRHLIFPVTKRPPKNI
ncbi:MAG: hypothetical protein ABIP78_03575 [Pyrinomonadaceae bacterium]